MGLACVCVCVCVFARVRAYVVVRTWQVTPTLGTFTDAMKNSFTDDYSSHGAAVTKAQSTLRAPERLPARVPVGRLHNSARLHTTMPVYFRAGKSLLTLLLQLLSFFFDCVRADALPGVSF